MMFSIIILFFAGCCSNNSTNIINYTLDPPSKLITSKSWYYPNNYSPDTVIISGIIPDDPYNDSMCFQYDADTGIVSTWSDPFYFKIGDSIELTKMTYNNPPEDTGAHYELKWRVRDMAWNGSDWSDAKTISVGHYNTIDDSAPFVNGDTSYTKQIYMWNNGEIVEIHMLLYSGNNFDAYLYDPNDYLVAHKNSVTDSVVWNKIYTDNKEGVWTLKIECEATYAMVHIKIKTLQFPPGDTIVIH